MMGKNGLHWEDSLFILFEEIILVQDECVWEDIAEQTAQGRLPAR